MKLTAPESIIAIIFGFILWAIIGLLMKKHIKHNPFKTKKMVFIIPSCIVLVLSFSYIFSYMFEVFTAIKNSNYIGAFLLLVISLPFIYIDMCFLDR